jgi:nickel/cobalt exporter
MSVTAHPLSVDRAGASRFGLHLALACAALAAVAGAAAALAWAIGPAIPLSAPRSPFGAGLREAAPSAQGLGAWLLALQGAFSRNLQSAVLALKNDGAAFSTLTGLGFAYGVFHAAGPGHGKAVISSYIVANEQTWTRGVVLSFASALLQAAVAVALVGVAAALLNATAANMMRAVNVIEILSYSLIVLIGVRLLFVKGRAFVNLLQTLHRPAPLGAAATPAHLTHDHHYHHDHHGSCCEHRHEHDHAHDEEACAWGHAHAPEPVELAGPGGWRRGLSAIVAVGLRPCSGAILVLIFALAHGLFWAGVVSTLIMGLGTSITVALIATLAVAAKGWARRLAESRSGYGMLVMRGIEAGAAVIIIGFGALLLSGYLLAERMVGI